MEVRIPYQAFTIGALVVAKPEYEGFFGTEPMAVEALIGELIIIEGHSIPQSQDWFILAPEAKVKRYNYLLNEKKRKRKPPTAPSLGGG